ncbi:MAG: PilW family protein [Azoarcus sp.]|nr:PilW family protein [Azoarcus sp.]
MKTKTPSRPRPLLRRALPRQGGMTLIELMISLLLGLFVIGGVLGIFTASREASRVNENLARVQENIRVAFDLMGHSIREADSNPCFRARDRLTGPLGVLNLANNLPSAWSTDIETAVRGYAGALPGGIIPPGIAAVAGSDAIILISGTSNASPVVFTPGAPGTVRLLPHSHPAAAMGNYILCHQNGGMAFRGVIPAVASGESVYPLPAPVPSVSPTGAPMGWLAELTAEAWFVGTNAGTGKTSLYRTVIAPGVAATEPIIADVVKMELRYLVDDYDNSGTSLIATPTEYVDAAAVNAIAVGSGSAWDFVRAVSVTLELRGAENVAAAGADRRLRRTLMHIASIRNRLP